MFSFFSPNISVSWLFPPQLSIDFPNFSNTPKSSCKPENLFLPMIIESAKFHGIGRETEDAKIGRRAILEWYTQFPNLSFSFGNFHRVSDDDVLNFMQALSSYAGYGNEKIYINLDEFFNGQDRDALSDSLDFPGLLLLTASEEDRLGR